MESNVEYLLSIVLELKKFISVVTSTFAFLSSLSKEHMLAFLVIQLYRVYETSQSSIWGGIQICWFAWPSAVSSLAVSTMEQLYILGFS